MREAISDINTLILPSMIEQRMVEAESSSAMTILERSLKQGMADGCVVTYGYAVVDLDKWANNKS